MIRSRFAAPELLYITLLQGKRQMYGIPSGLEDLSEEQGLALLKQVKEAFIEAGIVKIDSHGVVFLQPECEEIAKYVCDCSKCLIVSSQRNSKTEYYIFWRIKTAYMMAESIGTKYLFSKTSPAEISSLLKDKWSCDLSCKQPMEAEIPQIALTKAKRLCLAGQKEEAVRTLRKNGADAKTAWILAEAFEGNTDYLKMMLLNAKEEGSTKEAFYLADGETVFAVNQSVLNLRTCTKLTAVAGDAPQNSLAEIKEMFFND